VTGVVAGFSPAVARVAAMWPFATKTGFRTPEKRGSGVLDERGLGTPNPKPVWFLRSRFS